MVRKIIKLILVISCMIVIFCFSNDNSEKSTKKSDGVIIKSTELFLNRKLNNEEKKLVIQKLVLPVRKGAHFTIYFILGILVFSLLKEYRLVNLRTLVITVGICFLYACSDEVHQLFISGRSASVIDVFIDTLGSMSGSFIYLFISNLCLKKGKCNYE